MPKAFPNKVSTYGKVCPGKVSNMVGLFCHSISNDIQDNENCLMMIKLKFFSAKVNLRMIKWRI